VAPYSGNILMTTKNSTENLFLHLHNGCNLSAETPQQYTVLSDEIVTGDEFCREIYCLEYNSTNLSLMTLALKACILCEKITWFNATYPSEVEEVSKLSYK
jgi:hypothetical protein